MFLLVNTSFRLFRLVTPARNASSIEAKFWISLRAMSHGCECRLIDWILSRFDETFHLISELCQKRDFSFCGRNESESTCWKREKGGESVKNGNSVLLVASDFSCLLRHFFCFCCSVRRFLARNTTAVECRAQNCIQSTYARKCFLLQFYC
jgi:hypothetical protein